MGAYPRTLKVFYSKLFRLLKPKNGGGGEEEME